MQATFDEKGCQHAVYVVSHGCGGHGRIFGSAVHVMVSPGLTLFFACRVALSAALKSCEATG
jgi:hypothetical protein